MKKLFYMTLFVLTAHNLIAQDCAELDAERPIWMGPYDLAVDIVNSKSSNKPCLEKMIKRDAFISVAHRSEPGFVDEALSILLNHGADIESRDSDGLNALMISVMHNRYSAVKLLLEKGAKVNAQGPNGWTSLMRAADRGSTMIAELLLKQGAHIDEQCEQAPGNDFELVSLGCNGNAVVSRYSDRDMRGMTALMIAANGGHAGVAEELIRYGADMMLKNNKGETAYDIAKRLGKNEIIKLLEDAKVLNFIGAAMKGNNDLVKAYIADGMDVNVQNPAHLTALMYASKEGHLEVIETLLEHGSSVDMRDVDNDTALIIAAYFGHNNIVKTLIAHGADVNVQNRIGITALMGAARNGHNDIVVTLLDNNADIKSKNFDDGLTAFLEAVYSGHNDVVCTLLDRGADINDKRLGVPALISAAFHGHNDVVKTLINKGVDVNVHVAWFWTALTAAASRGYADVVLTLIENKADASMKDGWNRNVRETAELDNKKNVMDLLDKLVQEKKNSI